MKNSVRKHFWTYLGVLILGVGCAGKAEPTASDESAPRPVAKSVKEPGRTKAPEPEIEKPAAPKAVSTKSQKAAKTSSPPDFEITLDSPTQVIQKYTNELRGIVEPERATKGVRDAAKEQKIAEKVREFFDFEGLARLSLGRHWVKVSRAKQKEFSKLFVNLVEDSYLRRSRDIVGNYDLVYGREEVRKSYAKVTISVVRSDADVDIVYELHRKTKNWMIYNIILDDVDLIRNYQTQFNRLILENSFEGLLKRMRKKLEEVEKEVTL